LSEPGGVCVSGTAHDHIEGRNEFVSGFLGEQKLKNISRPIRACRVSVSAGDTAKETTSRSSPALPDKPSIAVLPFDNMSGDPQQDYFSDGMTEDIITALSRLRWLFVIARNSTFTCKGQAVDVKKVGREMGVRYVLEGSVRKAGNRLRVTAQLIEAATGNHIWAERYDRDLEDIFDLQDELTEAISTDVSAELAASERQMAHKKSGTNLGAWDLYQRGQWHFYKYTSDDFAEARRLFKRSADLSPEFAPAYAGLAAVAFAEAIFGHTQDPVATLQQGLHDAEHALTLDDRDPDAQLAIGRICMQTGDSDRCISAFEKAIILNPSYALAYKALGQALFWFGRADEAIAPLNQAIRLSPHDPVLWAFYLNRSIAHFFIDDIEAAIIDAKAAIQAKSDEVYPYLALASACSVAKRDDQAQAAFDRAYSLKPQLSEAYIRERIGTSHPPYTERFIGELRKLGLPEE
jgi:adenylate cyclase